MRIDVGRTHSPCGSTLAISRAALLAGASVIVMFAIDARDPAQAACLTSNTGTGVHGTASNSAGVHTGVNNPAVVRASTGSVACPSTPNQVAKTPTAAKFATNTDSVSHHTAKSDVIKSDKEKHVHP